jgi:hypothetical protein
MPQHAKNPGRESNGKQIHACLKTLKNLLYSAESKGLSGTLFVAVPLESGQVGDHYTRFKPATETRTESRVVDS